MRVFVLDSGAVTSLAGRARRSAGNVRLPEVEDSWSPVVPSIVLVECLSGRPRTDVVVNRLLKTCQIVDAPHEKLARRAAVLRARAGRGSAVGPRLFSRHWGALVSTPTRSRFATYACRA